MGLDMYAFSLDRSAAFSKPRDILNYRAPAGPALSQFVIGSFDLATDLNTINDEEFLCSRFVLPGSALLHRWRKHPDLHGWMERRWKAMRWHKKAGAFGCDGRVPLDVQDMDALEQEVRLGRLPKTTGFFFGESAGTEMEDDLAFIAAARAELAAGKFVYYTSWW